MRKKPYSERYLLRKIRAMHEMIDDRNQTINAYARAIKELMTIVDETIAAFTYWKTNQGVKK
jgi:hypothetical protein